MVHEQLVAGVKKIFNKIPDKSIKLAYLKALKRGDYTVLSVVAPIILTEIVNKQEVQEFKILITKLKNNDY